MYIITETSPYVTPDLHLTYSKNGGNLGLVLKMKNITCISILLATHVKYTYLYLFEFVLYSIVAFKAICTIVFTVSQFYADVDLVHLVFQIA